LTTEEAYTESGSSPPKKRSALAKTLTLTPQETLQIARRRYPDGLCCSTCARIVATRPSSYKPMTDAERMAWVCGECKQDRIEQERIAAQKAEQGQRLARATRRKPALGVLAPREDDKEVWTTDTPCDACGILLTNRETSSKLCPRCAMAAGDTVLFGTLDFDRLKYLSLGKPKNSGCASNGRHYTLEEVAECPFPAPTLIDQPELPIFCRHARPQESCLTCRKPESARSVSRGIALSTSGKARRERRIQEPSQDADRSRPRREPRRSRLSERRISRVRKITFSPEQREKARERMLQLNAARRAQINGEIQS